MLKYCLACIIAAFAATAPAAAAVVDPAGDFLGSYTGPQNGELDILNASVVFDGTYFHLSAVQNGPVGATPGAVYVWGVNRGGGTPRLTFGSPSIGAGVLFDAVAVMFPDGLARAVTFPSGGPPAITQLPGLVHVNGATISASFDAALFPSNGVSPADYTFTLWTRQRVNPTIDGTNAEIADFADGMRAAIPEPATWALMILGFGLVGVGLRRRGRPEPGFAV